MGGSWGGVRLGRGGMVENSGEDWVVVLFSYM